MPHVSLESLRIASPCPVPWEEMEGDDRVRFCGHCRLSVYNLSAMTRQEAEALVGEREGRLCVQFCRRSDGTVTTADCPVGFRAARRRFLNAIWLWLTLGGCLLDLFDVCRKKPKPPPLMNGTVGQIG